MRKISGFCLLGIVLRQTIRQTFLKCLRNWRLTMGRTSLLSPLRPYWANTLANHLNYGPTLNLVNQGNWDYVILQENSGYLANGGTSGFTASVNSFVNLIDNNSPDARILLYQVVPPTADNTSNYTNLQNNWNTLFSNIANNYSQVSVCNIGQAFTNAYNGQFGYIPLSPDQLRYGFSYGYHFYNSGGFLAAVTFYANIFNNKPCIPGAMTFIQGTASVTGNVPQFDRLAQIGYMVGRYATHAIANTPEECRFSYGVGQYPCD